MLLININLFVKGTQAWDNFEFFFTLIKSLYALRKFSKKISLLFLRFSPEFRCSNISAVTEHTRNQIFFIDIQKNFLVKIFTLVLLDRFLDGFSKFWFFIGEICILVRDFWVIFENRGNDFIACWAYAEPISSHAEHTRNEFRRTQPAVKCEHFYMYNPCWAYAERILSHTEHTGN